MDQAAFTHLPPQPGFSQEYSHPTSYDSSEALNDGHPSQSSNAGSTPLVPGSRPARSRRQRPCDSCRSAKRRCFKDDNSPCVACQATGSACTFNEPPHKRARTAAGESQGEEPPTKKKTPTTGKGKKKVVEEALDDGEENGGVEMGSSAGPGPKTQRMALKQLLDLDVGSSQAPAPSTNAGNGVFPGAFMAGPGPSEHPRILMPTYAPAPHIQGPLSKLLNRVRLGGFDYDHSERSTSQQEGGGREGQSPPPEESDLSHPGLDHSRLAASEPHFSAASAAEDPSLNFMASRVREVASTQGSGSVNKVFFVSAPSLIYPKKGPGAAADPSGGIAPLIRSLELLGKDQSEQLLETFTTITLPAIPILNFNRFQHHLRSYPMSELLYPSRLLTGILAHAIMYNPDLRAKQGEVWIEVYETLTHEFLQPRLQTIQLTLIDLISRPDKNPGGNSIALARAVGAAQLLGLHLDCSTWQLPRWERNLRKRLFWLLFVMDKWGSLLQGRPAHMHSAQYNVPVLTLDDFDSPYGPGTPGSTTSPSHAFSPASSQHNGQTMTQAAIDSAHSFIALTKLSVIVEELLEEFFTVKAQNLGGSGSFTRMRASRAGRQQKLRVIESYGADLDKWASELPDRLKLTYQYAPGEEPATGIRSMQLSYLGLTIVLGRLTGDLFDVQDEEGDFEAPLYSSLELTDQIVQFLERLTPTDLTQSFWISFTPYQLSNAMSLLIRCLLACRRIGHHSLLAKSYDLLQRFTIILKEHHRPPHCWDLAERALAKLLSLMPSVSRLCPEVGQFWSEQSEQIWAQMRASPTAEVLISSIPNNGLHPNPPPPPQPSTSVSGVHIPPPPPNNLQLSLQRSSHSTSYHDLPGSKPLSSPSQATVPRPALFDKPEDVEQYFSNILHNPASYPTMHGQAAFALPSPSTSRNHLGLPADRVFPTSDELSYETPFEISVGEEDIWAGVGNVEGFAWMGLGFEEGGAAAGPST